MTIEPITIWKDGVQVQGTELICVSFQDNLKDDAIIQYNIYESDDIMNPKLVANGSFVINGQDYIDWGDDANVNLWIYNWVADKLNLVII